MEIIAGLLCGNAEVFGQNGINHAIMGGKCLPLSQAPEALLLAIDASIDPVDHDCLRQMNKITIHEKREQWATCNLSKLDHTPDYLMGEFPINREFVECSKRDSCLHQKKLCRTQSQLTGLTPKEVMVLEHTYAGLIDKEIAQTMGISTETVKSHSQNIRIKKGLSRKADLVRYAQKLNLI